MKRIKIDGSALLQTRTGVGQYTYGVFNTLAKLDQTNDYRFFGFIFFGKRVALPPLNLPFQRIAFFPGSLYDKLRQRKLAPPINLFTGRADLYVFPNFVRWPLLGAVKSAIVIHDTSFLVVPEFDSPENLRNSRIFVPRSLKKATYVLAVSESAKRDVAAAYHLDPSTIRVVSPGYDPAEFHPMSRTETAPVLKKYGVTGPYIHFLGTLGGRKNVSGLIDAYRGLPAAIKQRYALVLTGSDAWAPQAVKDKLAAATAAGEQIIVTGYVEDNERPALHAGATVMVLPSFYEGFGMQLVEAMASGVPVIAANNSSLPEVVGEAGLLVETGDTQALTEAIERVLGDEALRNKMVKAGLQQATKFTWEVSARRFQAIVDKL